MTTRPWLASIRLLAMWWTDGASQAGGPASCTRVVRSRVDNKGNDYILGCDPQRTQVFDPDHQLIAGAYSPGDKIFVPIFGSNGEVYASDFLLPATTSTSSRTAF